MLRIVLVFALALGLDAKGPCAQTGPEVPEMAHYDTWAQGILDTYGLPGMSVAVMKEGRLVYARGFGVADPATNEPVRPQSRFRLASISKPITAAAAMWLVERGLLDLDAQAFAMLPDHPPLAGETEDPRLADITVRDLLQHSAGWDRDQTGYDPMFDVVAIGQANGLSGPAGCDEVIRFVRGRPLDFTPGTRYAYSNVGYCVLGRVMAEAARMSYHTLMQEFFATIGVGGMALGRTRFSDRLQDEVIYVEHYGQTCPSLLGEGTVPCPYGQFYIEAMDAHGGWVSSAPDLLRFVRAVDGRGGDDVLSASGVAEMTRRPSLPTWLGTEAWYGLGWSANVWDHWWHGGALKGTRTFMVRANHEDLAWVVLTNTWAYGHDAVISRAIYDGMWDQALATTSWPSHDLFSTFPTDAAPAPEASGVDLSVLANPSRTPRVRLSLRAPEAVRVSVMDALGREVAVLHDGPLERDTEWPLWGLAPGVYVIRTATPEAVVTARATIVR